MVKLPICDEKEIKKIKQEKVFVYKVCFADFKCLIFFAAELQSHLQTMITLLREEDSLKMVGDLS